MAGKENKNGKLSRRDFIRKSAVLGSSLVMAGRGRALGAEANSKIEVGFIGLGGRGRLIAKLMLENPNYKIVAMADYFEDTVDEAEEQFGIDKSRRYSGLGGYKKLIESGVDAVICETPPYAFPEHVTAAVEAGCHVYMAKPVACDAPGCAAVSQAAAKAKSKNKVFLVDYQMPTAPIIIETVKRIHQGDIGKVGLITNICNSKPLADPPNTGTIESKLKNLLWINDVNLGGGYLVNYGVHAIDVAIWMADSRVVNATGSSGKGIERNGDTDRVYSVTVNFENDCVFNYSGRHLDHIADDVINCNAFGEEGYAETNYWGKSWIRSNRPYRGGDVGNIYRSGIRANLDTFSKSILQGDYSNSTVERGVYSTLVSILMREAGRRKTSMTMAEVVSENKKLEVNYSGLKV